MSWIQVEKQGLMVLKLKGIGLSDRELTSPRIVSGATCIGAHASFRVTTMPKKKEHQSLQVLHRGSSKAAPTPDCRPSEPRSRSRSRCSPAKSFPYFRSTDRHHQLLIVPRRLDLGSPRVWLERRET